VLVSILSVFKDPVDYVNPAFVSKRMNEYYAKVEQLVTATRTLLPKNNAKLNNQLKRASPFVANVLETIRNWPIENIINDLAQIQSHPRSVRVSEFSSILKAIYRPLFILENLEMEAHIKGSFKMLYKILYIESPMDAKEKYQDVIRVAVSSYNNIRNEVKFVLYPLLMKLISNHFITYERIFIDRRRRFMAFLGVSESDRISAADITPQQMENVDVDAMKEAANEAEEQHEEAEVLEETETAEDDPKAIERRARAEAAKMERKALERGLSTLEVLFPNAGWEKIGEYPDMYPYFASTFNLKRGYELIAPSDPMQQISILMHVLEDIFLAIRYVKFGSAVNSEGNRESLEPLIMDIINNWQRYIEGSFSKEYLPRLNEYCRILENSSESRTSPYTRKILNELHWIKRLYFLPYYKFESVGPPPFQKQDVTPVYTKIRSLRRYLTMVAAGIEQGNHQGGAEAKAFCEGITNPWSNYNFEIPNSISRRFDMLLAPTKRNNASLIYFSLSTVAVLDYIINDENSWSYRGRPGPLFRSIKGEGIYPQFGVDEKLDADQIFRDSLKKN
jgi:hypothetical protein